MGSLSKEFDKRREGRKQQPDGMLAFKRFARVNSMLCLRTMRVWGLAATERQNPDQSRSSSVPTSMDGSWN